MALSPKELQDALETYQKSKAGDPFATKFIDSLRTQNTARAKEFLNAMENFEAESTSGVMVDPELATSLGLGAQQQKDCKEAAFRYAKKDPMAIAFFAGCERGAAAGVAASAAMLAFRDAILATLGQGTAEGTIPAVGAAGIHPPPLSPVATAPGHAFARSTVEARKPSAANQAPPAGPSAPASPDGSVPQTYMGTSVVDAGSFFGAAAPRPGTAGPLSRAEGADAPAMIMSLPPLTSAGLTIIKAAIAEGKAFSSAVVLTLIQEIEKLSALVEAPGVLSAAEVNQAASAKGPFVASPDTSNGHA